MRYRFVTTGGCVVKEVWSRNICGNVVKCRTKLSMYKCQSIFVPLCHVNW